jgi:hypothetical protein
MAIIMVLMLLVTVPLALADTESRQYTVDKFSNNHQSSISLSLIETQDNSTPVISLPRNAEIDKGSISVYADEYTQTGKVRVSPEYLMVNGNGMDGMVVNNEGLSPSLYTEQYKIMGDENLSHSIMTDLHVENGVQLKEISIEIFQDGFGGGPGQLQLAESHKFLDSDAIDWERHEGSIQIVPYYQYFAHNPTGVKPVPRAGMASALQPGNNHLIMYGGHRKDNMMPFDDLWAFDPGPMSWTQLCTACDPSTLTNASMVWDSNSQSIWITGGEDNWGRYISSFEWKASSWATQLFLSEGIANHSEIYAKGYDGGKAVMFGGINDFDTVTNNMSTRSSDTWNMESFAGAPSPRMGHSAVYDSAGNRMIIYGGTDQGGSVLSDVYIFDFETTSWQAMSNSQTGRTNHVAVFDEVAGAMLVFGGDNNDNHVYGDLWIYWPGNDTWTQANTNMPLLPRTDAAAVFSPVHDCMYMYGGAVDLLGTANDDHVHQFKRTYKRTGTVVSSIMGNGQDRVIPTEATVNGQGFTGVNPPGKVAMFVRTGDDLETSSWNPWRGPYPVDQPTILFPNQDMDAGTYFQYRLEISTIEPDFTPVVDNLTIVASGHKEEGSLETMPHMFESIPYKFASFDYEVDVPQNTMLRFTILTSPDKNQWTPIVINPDMSLDEIKPEQYVKFQVLFETENLAMTPRLFSLGLKMQIYDTHCSYIGELLTTKDNIKKIVASWPDPIDDSGNSGGGKIEVFYRTEETDTWHPISKDIETIIDPMQGWLVTHLFFNITLKQPGNFPMVFSELNIEFEVGITPDDVILTVDEVSDPTFEWAGYHQPGSHMTFDGFGNALQKHIAMHDKDFETPYLDIRLIIKASNQCNLTLKDLDIQYQVDNEIPEFVSKPETTAYVGYEYKYDVVVIDEDEELSIHMEKGPEGMEAIETEDNFLLLWTPVNAQVGDHEVTLRAFDGTDETMQIFTITVSDDKVNNPPVFMSEPPGLDRMTNTVTLLINQKLEYEIEVEDEDGDSLEVSLEDAPLGTDFDPDALTLKWSSEDGDRFEQFFLRVSDGKGSATQVFYVNVLDKTNKAPVFDEEIPKELKGEPGKEFTYKVKALDDDGDTIEYNLDGAPDWLKIDEGGEIRGTPPSKGEYPFTIIISDGIVETEASTTLKVEKETAPGIGGMRFDELLAILLLLIIIVAVLAAAGVAMSRRKKRKRAEVEDMMKDGDDTPKAPPKPRRPPRPRPEKGAAPVGAKAHGAKAGVGAAAAPTKAGAAAAAKGEEKPIIDEVYLIYNDGRLIAHQSKSLRPDMDEYVLSGMLKAIQEFVKDSLACEGSLGGLDYGERRIMIELGCHATLALVITGKETTTLREEMKRTLEKIQGLYAGVIEDWDGEVKHFKDVTKYLQPLILMGRTLEEDAEMGDVRVMSALEFYQGYVRLKVAIKNKYPYMIHDVSLKLIYDKKALQLSHIEPEYSMEGSEVEIGNISPKEKKTVAFYLDPLICMESNIDASAMYKNYKGEIKTEMMKRRPVDIVCPIFYTEQNVNVAMLKRLIKELKYSDRKVYSIPKSLDAEKALSLAKETVQAHDVKFVREFTEKKPFIGEAWFYGKTKQSLEDLVIRATAREEHNSLELFVASSNLATLPGLLADLAHGLKRRYTTGRKTKEKLTQVTDAKVKDQLEKSRLLIEKYATSEADAESDEIDL